MWRRGRERKQESGEGEVGGVCVCARVCVGGSVRRRGVFVFWLFMTGFVEFEVREGFSSKEAGDNSGFLIGSGCVCR